MPLQRHQRAIPTDSNAAPPFAGVDPQCYQFSLPIQCTLSPFPPPWVNPSNQRGCPCSREFCRVGTDNPLLTRDIPDTKPPSHRAISMPKWSNQFPIFLIPQDIS